MAVAAFAVFYLVPNFVEARLVGVLPPLVILMIGDALGCLAISRLTPIGAAGLYALLTSVEAGLLLTGTLSMHTLVWITDLVPALVLSVFAFAVVKIDALRD